MKRTRRAVYEHWQNEPQSGWARIKKQSSLLFGLLNCLFARLLPSNKQFNKHTEWYWLRQLRE